MERNCGYRDGYMYMPIYIRLSVTVGLSDKEDSQSLTERYSVKRCYFLGEM